MDEWKCPIEKLDEDIRDVVRVLYENNMHPYMSCSGSYKDHMGIPHCASLMMLDSQQVRELIANIINDKRFKCSILKENACEFYGNPLPNGLRLGIHFENICGDTVNDLLSTLQAVINGKSAKTEDKKKVDTVCDLISTFDVSDGHGVEFSFNDENVNPESKNENNYSISITDKKDFEKFNNSFGGALDGFIQNEHECRFFGSDYITMLAFLKKIEVEYSNIPFLRPGQKPRQVVDKNRIDTFMSSGREKRRVAENNLCGMPNKKKFESDQVNDITALLELFADDKDR